jgi:bacteriocin biosynthesis cyclodehydratase domain-containing protein
MKHQQVHRDKNRRSDKVCAPVEQRLVALPLQLVEVAGGVIVRRGSIQLLVRGDRSVQALETVVDAMRGEGASIDEICDRFAAPDRPTVQQLVQQLMARQFVVPVGQVPGGVDTEDQLDVFYWHFGLSARQVNMRLNQVQVAILGINHVSRQLASSLNMAGMTSVRVIDYPLLRNLSLFDEAEQVQASRWPGAIAPIANEDWEMALEAEPFDCLVATSDFGGLHLMRQWNVLCLERGRHFLPVVLQDMIGYVGPSVIPGESACFECFLSRLDSNRTADSQGYANEMAAFAGQHVAGFHPSMASVLGDIAAIELTKFYSRALPLWKIGSVTEVNLLAGRMESRKVLRVPRCSACSNLIRRSSTSMIKGSLTSKVIEA